MKQYKYFPTNTNIPEEINKALPKLLPLSSNTYSPPTTSQSTFVQRDISSYIVQTDNPKSLNEIFPLHY